MSSRNIRFRVVVKIRSPVLSRDAAGARHGIDSVGNYTTIDDAQYAVLPGTLIQGNLIDSLRQFADLTSQKWISTEKIHELFGQKSIDPDWSSSRGRLSHSDQWVSVTPIAPAMLTRIRIDPDTGVVLPNHLQTIEIPHPTGTDVDYAGWFMARLAPEEIAPVRRYLKKGLEYVSALGAYKGIGFGQIIAVTVDDPEEAAVQDYEPAKDSYADQGFSLTLAFDRPVCFARPHSDDTNRFESSDTVPGSAVVAALIAKAREVKDAINVDELLHCIDDIHVTTGQPTPVKGKKSRRSVVPLSLYVVDNPADDGALRQFRDAALETQAETVSHPAIRFQPDWKDADRAVIQKHFVGYGDELAPSSTTRVRTAIDPDTGAASKGQLFAMQCMQADEHVWQANIDLSAIESAETRKKVYRQIENTVACGLSKLGKTNAHATAKVTPRRQFPVVQRKKAPVSQIKDGDAVYLLLQSDALLFETLPTVRPTNDTGALHDAYADAWQRLSEGSMTLAHFFAAQRLYGGDFVWRRFGEPGKAYRPWLLTAAGSVFILTVTEAKTAIEKLSQWGLRGLPPVSADFNWKTCPLLAQNGYGEVQINPDIQRVIKTVNRSLEHHG